MPGKKPSRRGVKAKPRRLARRRPEPAVRESVPAGIERVARVRELFWHNVLRELLSSLSLLSAQREAWGGGGPGPARANGPEHGAARPKGPEELGTVERVNLSPMLGGVAGAMDEEGGEEEEEVVAEGEGVDESPALIGADPENIFDGRMAVITALGQRIPIAAVQPVFACGVRGRDGPDWLSTTVECTVFEIRTPGGEAFTLPVHEVRCFHSLTPELLDQIRTAARAASGPGGADADQPFGFAAYTSLARAGQDLREIPAVAPEFEGE